jgi:hypothetical protein
MDSSVSAFAVLAANSIVATSSFRGVPFAKPAPNPSVKGTSCAKAQAAPYVER